MKESVVLERGPETEIPECCFINIQNPDECVTKSLLTTCFKISENQPITDFVMLEVRCDDLTVKAPIMSSRAASLYLYACDLPVSYLREIIHQLFKCSHTLQYLELIYMDLKPIEKEIDELLERLVSFHESGEAQIKLRLWIEGNDEQRNNLSQEFIDKWRPRCKRIKSIDYMGIGDE